MMFRCIERDAVDGKSDPDKKDSLLPTRMFFMTNLSKVFIFNTNYLIS